MRIERKTISGLKNHYYDATRKTTTTKNKTKRKNTGRTKKNIHCTCTQNKKKKTVLSFFDFHQQKRETNSQTYP